MSLVLAILLALPSCDVQPVDVPPLGPVPTGAIGERGMIVVDSDYSSTNVAIVTWDGFVSRSLVSSSGKAGLATPLSGDVVVPPEPPRFTGDAVVLDRKLSVVSWLALSGGVRSQLSVGNGFRGDPWDYLEVSPTTALVARYNRNPDPSVPAVDRGGDLLVIDLTSHEVKGSIDLAPLAPSVPSANPARFARAADDAPLVLLQVWNGDYCGSRDGVVARIDPVTLAASTAITLVGLKNCGAMVRLDATRLVVSCTGLMKFENCVAMGGGGLAVIAEREGRFTEERRLTGFALHPSPSLAAATPTRVIAGAFGDKDTGSPDRWFDLDLETGVATELVHGEPFSLGDVLCGGNLCLGASADGLGSLVRFRVSTAGVTANGVWDFRDPFPVLLPRTLGRL